MYKDRSTLCGHIQPEYIGTLFARCRVSQGKIMQPISVFSTTIQSYPAISLFNDLHTKATGGDNPKVTTDDSLSLSPAAVALQTANTDTDFYPPGFPEAVRKHLEAMKNGPNPDINTYSVLSMELVVDPQMDLDHSPAPDGSIVMNRDVFQNAGFSMKSHIQTLLNKVRSQLGQGRSNQMNTNLLNELNKISALI